MSKGIVQDKMHGPKKIKMWAVKKNMPEFVSAGDSTRVLVNASGVSIVKMNLTG